MTKTKTSWVTRAQAIKKRFPATASYDWRKAFADDIELFGRIVRDILKFERAAPGRPGPRPALEEDIARRKVRQYLGQDYSELPFKDAFAALKGDRSIRNLAQKCGLEKSMTLRLLQGKVEPDGYILTQVAEAFGKSPSYFLEWRLAYIVNAIVERIQDVPEANIGLYRKLRREDG